jgi:hypothetical protein
MMLRKSSRGAISRHLIFVCGGILWSRGWSSIELMCLATFPAGTSHPLLIGRPRRHRGSR